MDLVAGQEALGGDAQRRRHAGAVRRHIVRIVGGADAGIEACIEAGRNAARPGEECVPDAGEPGQRRRFDAAGHVAKPGRSALCGAEIAIALNSVPMSARPEPTRRTSACGNAVALVLRGDRLQGLRAGLDAEPFQQRALLHRAMDARAGSPGGPGQRGKIHMGGEIGAARHSERARKAVRSHRLEGVAGGAPGMAIVDHQRGAAAEHPLGEVGRPLIGAPFENLADRSLGDRWRQVGLEAFQGLRSERKGEFVAGIDGDPPLMPAGRPPLGLVDGQGVEELVGEDDGGSGRRGGEGLVPAYRDIPDAAQRFALALLQGRAHLDEMHPRRAAEIGDAARRPQRVEHHGAAAGAELDDLDGVRRAHLPPYLDCPQPDHFAEHLADFRRGDEVAGRADGVAVRVIAVLGIVEAKRHECGHRHRPVAGDAAADLGIQRGALLCHHWAITGHHECRGWRRSAKAASPAPAMNSGMHSSMPMVVWPHRKPSWGSGSRKNSQNERNTA